MLLGSSQKSKHMGHGAGRRKPENGNDAQHGSGTISAFCSHVHDDLAETGSRPTYGICLDLAVTCVLVRSRLKSFYTMFHGSRYRRRPYWSGMAFPFHKLICK